MPETKTLWGRDATALIAEAADLAHDRLDIKLEHDGFAGPGDRSYSDEDVAAMRKKMGEFADLNFVLEGMPKYRAIVMSQEAYDVLCGLVQPSDEVNQAGIFSPAWDELRKTFPIERFHAAIEERGEDFYMKEFGT